MNEELVPGLGRALDALIGAAVRTTMAKPYDPFQTASELGEARDAVVKLVTGAMQGSWHAGIDEGRTQR